MPPIFALEMGPPVPLVPKKVFATRVKFRTKTSVTMPAELLSVRKRHRPKVQLPPKLYEVSKKEAKLHDLSHAALVRDAVKTKVDTLKKRRQRRKKKRPPPSD